MKIAAFLRKRSIAAERHHALPPYIKSLGIETQILENRGQDAVYDTRVSAMVLKNSKAEVFLEALQK